ncbi:alpha/beta fold hydrolase [Lapidilactobacillus mulanensis]|uniref:Alpha/beta fold hydrolase n=1 Tax=Lapidilactobacillus mulanensis TaxID=2485999 RepID=A0ABW4DNQ2_9LACO|nr:alpha/beta hydrolase [Lapidilactobacillus mulanensis]
MCLNITKILEKKSMESEGLLVNAYSNISKIDTDSTLVFIHGAGENPDCWFEVIRSLINKVSIIVLERPGYGLSQENPIDNIELTKFVLEKAVESYRIKRKYILVGHSLGGYISLLIQKKLNIQGRILISSFCRFKLLNIDLEQKDILNNIKRGFSKYTNKNIIDNFFKNIIGKKESIICDYHMTENLKIPDVLKAIKSPCLSVHAAEDHVVSSRQSKLLEKVLKGTLTIEVEQAGHNVILERPKYIADIIASFLVGGGGLRHG